MTIPDPPGHATALLRSAAFQGHDTGDHPENPSRLRAIEAELARADLLQRRPEVPFGAADPALIERVHDPRYVAALVEAAERGGGWLDADTIVRPDSVATARLAVGAAVAGVDAVLDGQVRRVFALVRPPGHHAAPRGGMGFCLLNNIAVAAAHALDRGLDRVAILDWDVHHGNGTQDAFYESDRVFYCSIHQSPLYPGTGAAAEHGTGAGEGYTLNVRLAPRQGDAAYRGVMEQVIAPVIRAYRPQLLLVSAGFDAHAADPLADMRLTEAGFSDLAARAVALAEELCDGRLVAGLEGGYAPDALARSVAATVRVFDGQGGRAERRRGSKETEPRSSNSVRSGQ